MASKNNASGYACTRSVIRSRGALVRHAKCNGRNCINVPLSEVPEL
eukprot:CAMPEP_0203651922 /NCGR_PEP_ID=MMETSP0088-20131115/28772_1 /ASSEMBLY_ACC=CAM_ASM_001087 /TAXON_ID=426623 /ORGANISM="Chaetoceros affinis, Strain CCMP159" /LENGTH=45 /DNA_ID= /DNA_START= /DNA_END= /DNA_ORIENTATION=